MAVKQGGKNRKYGRNKKFCDAYKASHTREKNKIIRLTKHCERLPSDAAAAAKLESLKNISGMREVARKNR